MGAVVCRHWSEVDWFFGPGDGLDGVSYVVGFSGQAYQALACGLLDGYVFVSDVLDQVR